MKWLKLFLSVSMLLLAIPMWRFLDMVAWIWPIHDFMIIGLMMWIIFFVILPVRAFVPVNGFVILFLVTAVGTAAWMIPPLTTTSTLNPEAKHCSAMTFTGFFYPARMIANQSMIDDLEVRNQICWVTKIMRKTPEKWNDLDELRSYVALEHNKLMKPDFKYKAALPWVALFFGRTLHNASGNFEAGSLLLKEMNFFADQYTYEIHSKQYGWTDWPHSVYIRWEYGLIERNWQFIVDEARN